MDIFSAPFFAWFAVLSGVFLLTLGILVFSQNPRNPVNRLFGLICLVFIIWMSGTFMMLFSDAVSLGEQRVIFWDRFVYLGVVFMPALQYHFGLVLAGRKMNRPAFAAYVGSFLFLLSSQSEFFVSGLFRHRWGVHTVAAPLHHLFLAFFFFYIFALLDVLFRHLRSESDPAERKRTILSIIAFAVLNLVGGLGYLPAYGIGIFPVFLIAPTVFASIIGYSIIRYEFLDVKVLLARAAVIIMLTLNGMGLLFTQSSKEFALSAVIFVSVVVVGLFLVHVVKKDVERKEELQKISNALATANQRLKELDNAKSEFVSIASHQLRTPLTALKGYLSLILEGSYGKISPELRDVTEKLYAANGNLMRLVEDLLSVSRIETGRIQYRFEPARIEEIVSEQVDMFIPVAESRGLSLRLNLPKHPLPELSLDAGKIREAVSNLVDNAIKYTRKGSVTVTVEPHGHDAVRVVVEDTGAGFGSEDREKLFRKFVRSEKTAGMAVSGTGLGLYVGKSFVEAHGGAMTAESEGVGKGARFTIELPLRKAGEGRRA